MHVPYFRSPPTVKCTRCELRYPEKKPECPHCKDLSDSGLKALKLRFERKAEAHARLGKIMFAMAAIILLITVLLSA